MSNGYGYNRNPNNFTATSHLYQSVRPSSPTSYEASGKDLNFVLIEKENAPVKKETERLVMAKDTGKQFVSTSPAAYTGFT
ncbi:hypothetical protein GOODEAATRI_021251 [Goodea atripinnis]|uniref:Uncharacterized protein n=1 Tax=Goodea atripinnis TaxID=208336 RepID=A0ABV0MUM3_9TELE